MQHGQRLESIHQHPAFITVERILLALQGAGHQAVLAGGCVRDALLGVAPRDFDVATSAYPEEIERLFPVTLAVGKAFGTIVVIDNGYNMEVTTFRTEGPYLDGRRPSAIGYSTMEEDAKRRDFTVNAFFYDPMENLVFDFVGGREDLSNRLLRTVGVAEERFAEDHLRLLRAVRFVSQLGFTVEFETMAAIEKFADRLARVSAERILHEMQRLLVGANLQGGLSALKESGLFRVCWPEIATLEVRDLKSFLSFMSWENAFAAVHILLDVAPEPRLRAWKASRESAKRVKAQIEGARALLSERSSRAERVAALGSPEFAETLVLASGLLSLRGDKSPLDQWIEEYLSVAGPGGELPKPFLNGEDLASIGVPASEEMGRLLKALYAAQLEGQVRSREEALRLVEKLQRDL